MFKGPEVSEHQGNVESANVAGERQRATVRAAASDRRDPWSMKVRLGAIRAVPSYHLARAGGATTTSATAPSLRAPFATASPRSEHGEPARG